jgi:hypothetical protein
VRRVTEMRIHYALVLLLCVWTPAHAAVCLVPGSYASVQAAVNDNNCSEIQVASGTYAGSVAVPRSVSLVGAGPNLTTIQGIVSASGNATNLALQGLLVKAGCLGSGIAVSGGARVTGFGVITEGSNVSQCPGDELIFKSGFEN